MKFQLPPLNIPQTYAHFNAPIVPLDCGQQCAPYNPNGKPFCCDICHAVPAAYHQEWEYLEPATDLWHPWRGDECAERPEDPTDLRADTPDSMLLLACLGPDHCQRDFRALSCRQFPFFPYVTEDYRFLGLAPEWEFFDTCWVLSHLGQVTPAYRREFVGIYDDLFSLMLDEMDGYAAKSEEMRAYFSEKKRRIPILHRNGGYYLLSPASERLARVAPEQFPRHGFYR